MPFGEPSRGDVVVFHFPGHSDNDPAKGENFIKRVIGVPGDTVVFEGDGVILNGEPLKYDNKGIYAGHKGQGEGANLLVEHLPGRTHTVLETDYPRGGASGRCRPASTGDGRQPRQQRRRPFLGPAAGGEPARQGLPDLAELRGWFCKDGFEPSRIGSSIN